MSYVADVMWGVVVDENKYKTRVLEDGSMARVYKITGTKALNVKTLELVDTGVKAFNKYIRIYNSSSYLNRYAIAVLDKNGNYIGGFLCKYSSLEGSLKKPQSLGNLLIYGQSTNLLYGEECCSYLSESPFVSLRTAVLFDLYAKSAEVRLYSSKTDINDLNYLASNCCAFSTSEVPEFLTKDDTGIASCGGLCYVSNSCSKTVILPENCKYLMISDDEDCEIESIVFNKGIERVSDRLIGVVDIDTYYISRDVSKEFMGNLLYLLLYDSIVEEWNIKTVRKEAYYMFHGGKLADIYDLCNKEENRIVMNSVLGDKTIVIY